MNRCDMSATYDRAGRDDGTEGFCYFHGKAADGLLKGWRPRAAAPERRHEIRPGESVMGRPEKYPYTDWFDGEPHILEHGVDFDSNPAAMRAMIRSAARTRHVTIRLQRRGPQISVQADLDATRAA